MSVGFFFFQAEDGIRDLTVTGVQTCAVPIYLRQIETRLLPGLADFPGRSDERRRDEAELVGFDGSRERRRLTRMRDGRRNRRQSLGFGKQLFIFAHCSFLGCELT